MSFPQFQQVFPQKRCTYWLFFGIFFAYTKKYAGFFHINAEFSTGCWKGCGNPSFGHICGKFVESAEFEANRGNMKK